MPFSLDQSFIVAAEEKLGAKLPYSYRHAMMKDNGGAVQADGDYWHLYPIRDNSDRNRLKRSCNDILYETRLMREWRGGPGGRRPHTPPRDAPRLRVSRRQRSV